MAESIISLATHAISQATNPAATPKTIFTMDSAFLFAHCRAGVLNLAPINVIGISSAVKMT